MPDNRIRFSAQFDSSGADKVKRDLDDVREGRKALDDVIGSGARVRQEAAQGIDASAQASQNILKSVEDSTRALQAAFTALPQGVQQSLAQVMDKVRQADIVGAMQEKARVKGVPQGFADQLDNTLKTTVKATSVQPGADVAATIRQTLPQTQILPSAAHAATRAAGEPPNYEVGDADSTRPTPILRSALEALKQGDLETARDRQRLAARTSMRTGDREGMETSTRMTRALREAGDKDNGIASGRRYAATIKSLEERLEAAEAAEADTHGSYLTPKTAMGRAARTLSTAHATLSGGISKGSELTGLEGQAGRIQAYIGQAEKGGAKGREVDDLKEQLEKLTEQLGKTRESYEQAKDNGGGGQPRQPDGSGGGGGLNKGVLDEMKRFAGSGMGGGMMGRTLMKLGPYGMAAGAVLAGNSLAERMVAAPNRKARELVMGESDLARQYGHDGDPYLFRSQSHGLSDQRLIDMGYTSSQASTTLARLDTPAAGNIEGAKEDTLDILQLSRSTGLDEAQIASAMTSLYEAGAYKTGEGQEPLEVIKLALTESVRSGVSQSETLRNLVELTAEGVRQGRSASPEALAMQAALQASLADLGVKSLKGDAGADAQRDLNTLVTGGDDPAMMMMLAPALEGITPADLKLTGASAKQFENLQETDPTGATFMAMELLQDGRSPKYSAKLAARMDEALGDNPGLYDHVLKQYGLGAEQRLAVTGGGGLSEIYEEAAAAATTGAFAEGEALETDVQGQNDLASRSRKSMATTRDREESKGTGTLNAVGDVGEMVNRGKTRGVRFGRNFLSQGGAYDERTKANLKDGSLSNAPGEAVPADIGRWQDRIPGFNRLFGIDDERQLELPDVGAIVSGAVPIPTPDVRARVRPPVRNPLAPPMSDHERRSREAFGEMSMGVDSEGHVVMTNQPGEIYGEEVGEVGGGSLVGEKHQGVDIVIGERGKPDPIYNPFDNATIMDAGESKLGGNYMVVQAPDGQPYKLSHLDQPIDQSRIGENVPRGGVLGIEGNSGASTGFHAHLELYDDFGGEQGEKNRRDNQDPQRFYERFYNSLESGKPGATNPAEPDNSRVDVYHHGLDSVRVEGLEGSARQKAEASLREFGKAVRTPKNHAGFG